MFRLKGHNMMTSRSWILLTFATFLTMTASQLFDPEVPQMLPDYEQQMALAEAAQTATLLAGLGSSSSSSPPQLTPSPYDISHDPGHMVSHDPGHMVSHDVSHGHVHSTTMYSEGGPPSYGGVHTTEYVETGPKIYEDEEPDFPPPFRGGRRRPKSRRRRRRRKSRRGRKRRRTPPEIMKFCMGNPEHCRWSKKRQRWYLLSR